MKNYKLVSIVSQSKSAFAYLLLISIVALPLGVQAQYNTLPTDYDRLLLGETLTNGTDITGDSNCRTTSANYCSGVLYMRFANPSVSGTTISFEIDARAGQAATGTLQVLAECRNAAGEVISTGVAAETSCSLIPGASLTPGERGNINAENPANIMFAVRTQMFYSKTLYPDNTSLSGCTLTQPYNDTIVANVAPTNSAPDAANGEHIFDYQSDNAIKGAAPGTIDPANLVQWLPNTYKRVMDVSCTLPANSEDNLWGMAFHPSGHNQNGHHVAADVNLGFLRYSLSPENSLEFFPLDNTNYITHAEITEDGKGVLIEYAQAVTDNANQAYTISTSDGSDTGLSASATWLNDKTVWLKLGGDNPNIGIYSEIGTAARSTTPLSSDRHVLVSSRFPVGTNGFGNNFAGASTYRAVLTQHVSVADYAGTAPKIDTITVNPGTESIALTFTSEVCGSPESEVDDGGAVTTVCTALTAAHFEVLLYDGVISSTEDPTQLSISSVDLTGNATDGDGYTAATLNLDLQPGDIGSGDYLIVRTARNSRFTDNFITDRTIFSATRVSRDIPRAAASDVPYMESEAGMLHLQAGALVQAIPTITLSLANDPDDGASVGEGDGDEVTSTFLVERLPEDHDMPTSVTIRVTRDNADNDRTPDNRIDLTIMSADGNTFIETPASSGVWLGMITFSQGENSTTVEVIFNGNLEPGRSNVYTIDILPPLPQGIEAENSIQFTIEDDEDNIPPSLPGGTDITEVPGATQVALRFNAAYDTADGNTFTRNVNYIINIMRVVEGKAPSAQEITIPAAEAVIVDDRPNRVNITQVLNSRPSDLPIEILLTREDYVFIPGDSYMVDISVMDNAGNPASDEPPVEYRNIMGTFTMGTDVGDELATFNCGTGTTDADSDDIPNWYELQVGTDCNNLGSASDQYRGDTTPSMVTNIQFDSGILVAGALELDSSSLTTVDAGVMCTMGDDDTDCTASLRAYVLSSGTNDFSGEPSCLTSSSNPSESFVCEQTYNDGELSLPLGFSAIDWVAIDENRNMIIERQLVYVAPVVALNGPVDVEAAAGVLLQGDEFTLEYLAAYPGFDDDDLQNSSIDQMLASSPTNGHLITVTKSAGTSTATFTAQLDISSSGTSSSHEFTLGAQHEDITFGTQPDPFFIAGNPITISEADNEDNPVATPEMREPVPAVTPANPNMDTAQLLAEMNTQSAIEVPFGYDVRLGPIAATNMHTVSNLDLGDNATSIVGSINVPPGYGDEGVFEFNTHLPDNVNTVYAAIPLATTLIENKAYYKYIDGSWRLFDNTDGSDQYWSAPGTVAMDGSVTCPPPVEASPWRMDRPGLLVAGDQCVLLRMLETGNNDADSDLDGVVLDPGAPGALQGGGVVVMVTIDGDSQSPRTVPFTYTFGGEDYRFTLMGNEVVVTRLSDGMMLERIPLGGSCTAATPFDCQVSGGRSHGRRAGSGATDFWFLAALLGLVALPPMIRRYRLRRQ